MTPRKLLFTLLGGAGAVFSLLLSSQPDRGAVNREAAEARAAADSAAQPFSAPEFPMVAPPAQGQGSAMGSTAPPPPLPGDGDPVPALPAWPEPLARDERGHPYLRGPAPGLEAVFALPPGAAAQLSLPGGLDFAATVRTRSVGGSSIAIGLDFAGGLVALSREGPGSFRGHVLWTGHPEAHAISPEPGGQVRVTRQPAKDLFCASWDPATGLKLGIPPPEEFGEEPSGGGEGAGGSPPAESPPLLDSRPSATAVVYLDFDGETVTGTLWNSQRNDGNPIVAAPSTLSQAAMTGVWKRVSADLSPFHVSVTTMESRYLAAPANRRIRVIITPTSEWYGTAGGVAYLNSFTWTSDTPCWTFENRVGYTERNVAVVSSHEIGHTFGLRHDGRTIDGTHEEYYGGHGSGATSWAPIMGVGYSRTIVQWSKGEYFNANRPDEDDLAIIAGAGNGFGYRTDQHGDAIGAAAPLPFDLQTGEVNVAGVIETTTDADVFRFTPGVGQLSLVVSMAGPPGQTEAPAPTLDMRAELLDASGAVLQTSNPAGTASASLTRSVAGGTYYLRLSGTGFGNPMTSSPTGYTDYASLGQYWISGTVPPKPPPPVLTPGSDSGLSNSDRVTNVTAPVFTGQGVPGGGGITLASNLAGVIGTGSVNGAGNWTITSAALADGVHLITQRQATGPESNPVAVTIDTIAPGAPALPDLSPASDSGISDSDNLTNVTAPVFFLTAEAGSLVELFADGSLAGSATAPPSGPLSLASAALADGTRLITARATDLAGNASPLSPALAVTIDTVAPLPPSGLRVAAASDSGLSSSDNITNITNPVISGVTEPNAKVSLFIDGTLVGTHPAGGNWSIQAPHLAEGPREIRSQAEDAAGNLGHLNGTPLIAVIDTTPPAAPAALRLTPATDTGLLNDDNLTRLTNPVLQGAAEPGSRVQVLQHGSQAGLATTAGNGTWTLALSGLPEGITPFTARQTDLAGNVGPLSAVREVEVDLTPPPPASAPVLSPGSDTGASSSDRITRLQSLVLTGTAEPGGRVTLLADGVPSGTSPTGLDGAWSITSSLLSAGTRSLRVRAEDRAGNAATEESPATEVTIILSASPPENFRLDPASDLGFSNSDGITSDTAPWFTGDSPPGSTIHLSIGTPPNETALGSGPGGPGWRVKASTLPGGNGIKTIRARVTDIAGNLSSAATTQVDIRTAEQPLHNPINLALKAGNDTGISATDRITKINTPVFTGIANFGDMTSIRLRLEADGQIVAQGTIASGFWEMQASPLADGTRQIRARLEDFAGNLSPPSTALAVTIDTVPPAAPSGVRVAPSSDTGISDSDGITSVVRPAITGTAEPGEVLILLNGIIQPGASPVDGEGRWSFTPAADLPEGLSLFSARQTDIAGNQGADSPPLSIIVDTIPPGQAAAPVLDPASDLGPSASDRVTSQQEPRFTGAADPGDLVVLFADGVPAGSGAADPGGAWAIDSDPLEDGARLITARLSDPAGNLGPVSPPLLVTIDTDPPVASIGLAPGQDAVTVEEPLRFAISFSKPAHGFSPAGVTLSGPASAGASLEITGPPGGTDYLVEITGTSGEGMVSASLAPGAATDLAGNASLATPGPPPGVLKKLLPDPVAGVDATRDEHPDKVTVTWHSLPGIDGYRVYRHPFPNAAAAEEIGQAGPGATSFDDQAVPPGVWFSYWVRAEDEDGLGPHGIPASGRAWAEETDRALTPMASAPAPEAEASLWEDAAAGFYDGLLLDASDERTLLGAIETLRVNLPRNGGPAPASAVIRLKGRSFSLRGAFDAAGRLEAGLRQRDGSVVLVDLQLMQDEDGEERVRGTVAWDGLHATADLPRSRPAGPGRQGAYTVLLPALPGWGQARPGGDGWATARVAPSGAIAIAGQLGDGARFTERAWMSASGAAAIYADLYRSRPERGRIGGTVTFRDQPEVSDFDGVLHWTKFPDPRERLYPDGFDAELWALGSRFEPPVPGERSLPQLAPQEHNARITFSGAGPEGGNDIERVLTWQAADTLRHHGPEPFSGRINRRTGALSGSRTDPATRARLAFTGAVFQKQGRAAGHFLNGSSSGAARLLPGTGFAYPGSEDPGNLARAALPPEPPPAAALLPSPPGAGGAGTYHGILSLGGAVSGALENVKLTAAGDLSGVLWLDGVRHSLKGKLGQPISIARPGQAAWTLVLALNHLASPSPGADPGFGLSGTLHAGGEIHEADAQRLPSFSAAFPASQAGAYTLVLSAPPGADPAIEPGGDGHAALSVTARGACTGLIHLADGQRASLGGHLGRARHQDGEPVAEWSFHRGLYGRVPGGYLAGKLVFRGAAGLSHLDGQWRWMKRPGAAPAGIYPGGFDLQRPVVGSRYQAPARNQRAFPGLADDWHNLWLQWSGPLEFHRAATWTTANRVTYFGPERLTVSFAARSGLITGRWRDATAGADIRFSAVILQEQGIAAGSYLWQAQSGAFTARSR